jgi:hypothetical protein
MLEVNKYYSRKMLYDIFKVPKNKRNGAWLRGHVNYEYSHGAYFHFIFANINIPGHNKLEIYDYENHFDKDNSQLFNWVTQTQRSQNNPSMKSLLADNPFIFIRTEEGDHWKFIGIGNVKRVTGNKPVKVQFSIENNSEEIDTFFKSKKISNNVYEPLIDFKLSEKTKIFSSEIPQANSLEKIEKLVEFASKNIWRYYLIENELNLVRRQVKYYVSAASLLGLVEGYKPHNITELGKKFLTLNATDKNLLLRELILNTKAMKLYLSLMHKDPNIIFENYRKFAVNINDTTLKRRLSNLKKWADFCHDVKPLKLKNDNPFSFINDDELQVLSKMITIEKDEGKSSDARNRHNLLVNLMEEKLSSHNNATIIKEWNNIDLIFENKDNLIFFEMKSITDENKGDQLKKALGQLIFYKNVVEKSAELVVVLESYFSDIDFLENDPICIVWKDGESFNASEKTKKQLKVIFGND